MVSIFLIHLIPQVTLKRFVNSERGIKNDFWKQKILSSITKNVPKPTNDQELQTLKNLFSLKNWVCFRILIY